MTRRRYNAHVRRLAKFWIDRLRRDVLASVVRHRSVDTDLFEKMEQLLVRAMGDHFINDDDTRLEAEAAMDWQRLVDNSADGWDRTLGIAKSAESQIAQGAKIRSAWCSIRAPRTDCGRTRLESAGRMPT